jgi:glycosyltransferase involved in cell wall biosynthesis
VFHPDTSANSTVLTDLATGLADRGVDVTTITTQPSYTSEDRAKTRPRRETHEGVTIRRLPATRFNRNDGVAYRMANEVSFFLVAFAYLLYRRPRQPLLLPTSPTFLPVLGWLLKPARGGKYVPIVFDLYPDMAVQLGFLAENGLVYRVWDYLNRRTYRGAVETVTIGETIESTLKKKYGCACRVTVIHNWEDGDWIRPQSKAENAFARENGFLDELTILYSGNLGQHHDLESVIKAAASIEMIDTPRPVHFVFIGEGGKKATLQSMVEERNLDSVSFRPYQPEEVLPDSLTSGDVALVTMEEGVEGLCVSSKFYTALASGQAVLAISNPDAEIGSVVERTGCGIRVDPGNPDQIREAIEFWLANPNRCNEMGTDARAIFETGFTRKRAIDRYLETLRDVATE